MIDCMYDNRPERDIATVVDNCKDCGCDLHEGESYYDMDGIILCTECIDEYRKEGM